MKKLVFSRTTVIAVVLTLFVPFLGCVPRAQPVSPPLSAEISQAEFEVISLEVSPTEVVEGKPALVAVKVTNTGEADGVYEIVLKVNEVERAKKNIPISAGATEGVVFELVENISGLYTLSVDGRAAILKVVGAGFLGQSLTLLKDSNGKIVASEPLQVDSPCKEKVEVYKMRYLSDGLEVVGFLVKPKANNVKYPAMIFNRGGNREFGKIEVPTLKYLSYLSANGYVVVASQYRGNDGGQGREEFGGSDRNDVINLIPLLDSLPSFVDSSKIVMLGYSRGGMMTYIAVTETDRIKAAAVVGGITDLIQGYYEREQGMKQVLIELVGGTPEQKEAEYKERSAYFWPEKINTPVLILHGEADWRVGVTQAQKLADKLKELGKTYELVTYPGGSHGLSEYSADRDHRILKWFAQHLQ